MTVGKRVQFDDETWAAVNLLRQERRRSLQQLADFPTSLSPAILST